MRTSKRIHIQNPEEFKQQLFDWSQQFQEVLWLDSNAYQQTYSSYDAILAVEAFTMLKTDEASAFEKLQEFQEYTSDWIFGYLTYDLKNDVENLISQNHDRLDFPDLYFFQPKKLFLLKGNELRVEYLRMVDDEIDDDLEVINKRQVKDESGDFLEKEAIKIRLSITKDVYYEKIQKVLDHIQRGDIYEANFCQEFYAETKIDPYQTYKRLNTISKPPFASFLKLENHYILSASPERYLRKEGSTIITQPIKGTAKRSNDTSEDKVIKETLERDPKERAENIMIVDLVRNDLSKTAVKGSVSVKELCKIYTFDQVHQMISTVTSTVTAKTAPVEILKTTFPMGSMTGAPKVSAMQIIEDLEETKRGVYSGAIGYFDPNQDFDFNVVIRSILYNAQKENVSFSVGGAITSKSIPEKEYEECLLKAKAMREALLGN